MKGTAVNRSVPRAVAIQHGRNPLLLIFVGISIGLLQATLIIPARQGVEIVTIEAPSGTTSPQTPTSTAPLPADGTRAAPTGTDVGDEGQAVAGEAATTSIGEAAASPTSGEGATSPAAGAAGSAPAGGTLGPVQGITATEIHLGIGIPDLGALAALGPDYDFGDPQDHIEALLAKWRDEGRLPVHGRDIVPFYRRYDIVGTDQQRAACKGWALDDKVFAVMAVNQFWAEGQCVTAEEGLPLITSLSTYAATYEGTRDLYVDLQMSTERIVRNFAHWGHDMGHFEGRTIGIYYASGYDGIPIQDGFIDTMHQLGYEFEVEITTDSGAYGSPSDNVAAQQFAANDVDLALLFVSAINQTNFMQQAESQLYRPTYLVTDIISSTNDVATSTYPVAQYDGTYGLTNLRYGEESAGLPKSPEAAACEDNYEAYSGKKIDYQSRPAEWLMLLSGCDEGEVVLQAFERAGRDLNLQTFLDAIYQTTELELGLHSPVTLRRDLLGGTSAMRTVQWHGDCQCFHAIGDFQSKYGQ